MFQLCLQNIQTLKKLKKYYSEYAFILRLEEFEANVKATLFMFARIAIAYVAIILFLYWYVFLFK